MRYGIVTANLGEYADPRVAVDLARAAEEAGWEAFFVWDHLGFVRGCSIRGPMGHPSCGRGIHGAPQAGVRRHPSGKTSPAGRRQRLDEPGPR